MKQSRISLFTVVVFLMVLSAASYIVWSGFTTFFGTHTPGSFWEKQNYTEEFEATFYIDDLDLSMPCVARISHDSGKEAGSHYSNHYISFVMLPDDETIDVDDYFDPDEPIHVSYMDYDYCYITLHGLADDAAYQALYDWQP